MDPQQPQPTPKSNPLKPLYWIAALAMAAATVITVINKAGWMAITSRTALTIAVLLLATAREEETRVKKIAIYALVAISLALLLVRLVLS